jgi:hypothetical protein
VTRTEYDDRVEYVDGPVRLVMQKSLDFAATLAVYVDLSVADARLPAAPLTWTEMDSNLAQAGKLI